MVIAEVGEGVVTVLIILIIKVVVAAITTATTTPYTESRGPRHFGECRLH